MFGEKAVELLKELKRATDGSVVPFNDDLVRQVLEEMKALYEQNVREAREAGERDTSAELLLPGIHVRHAALERDKRCLLAYVYNRLQVLKSVRWQFGSILPPDVRSSLNEHELAWFSKYSRSVATYMQQIGGINLTQNMKPPKTLYIQVLCVEDYGEFETGDGEVIHLTPNSQHFMRRSDCEQLIRQGVLKHIT